MAKLDDSNLLNFIKEEELNKIALCFSKGEFSTIVKEYLNDNIISKMSTDSLTQQLAISILLFCQLKSKLLNDAKITLLTISNQKNALIFPLLFLKAKAYIYNGEYKLAIELFSEMKYRYDSFKSNSSDNNDIIYIETNESKFKYFSNLFIYLFGINNIDTKIKKIYFELSHTLASISLSNESFALIEEMHKRYPNDIVVLFTYAKLSLMLSYKLKYETVINEMKELSKSTEEPKKKSIIDNYITFASTFESIGKNDYEKAKNTLISMRNQSPNNPLIENNISVINVLTNKVDEGYNGLLKIVDKNNMNSSNDAIVSNVHTVSDYFNKKYFVNP